MLRRSISARSASSTATSGTATACDVIVSGGGLVGAAMMAALQQLRVRLGTPSAFSHTSGTPSTAGGRLNDTPLSRLMMVDAARHPTYDAANIMHQLRTVSITPVNSRLLDNLGGWGKLTTKHPYYRMAIRHEQANSPTLSDAERCSSFFMTSVLGSKASTEPLLEFTDLRKPVGFICFNTELNAAMVSVVEDQASLYASTSPAVPDALCFDARLQDIRLPPVGDMDGEWGSARLFQCGGATKETGEEKRFALVLGCEGRGSPLRDVLHSPSVQHDYSQTAFVCTVRVPKQADGNPCCFQNFFRDGMIIAYLPTSDETANIVFSTTPQHVRTLNAMSQQELVAELNSRLHSFAPNDIPEILEVPQGLVKGEHKRAHGSFPLRLNVATTPYAPRALLVGDAAHGIHPFAGQGLNLGLYDVCALTQVLEGAVKAGQDIGSTMAVGEVYASEMLIHAAPMIASMEALKHLVYGAPGFASIGMKALNSLPIVSTLGKDAILQVASGAAFASRHKDCFLMS